MNITAAERAGDTGPDALAIADRVAPFVRNIVLPYERDTRFDHHASPTEELVQELKQRARRSLAKRIRRQWWESQA